MLNYLKEKTNKLLNSLRIEAKNNIEFEDYTDDSKDIKRKVEIVTFITSIFLVSLVVQIINEVNKDARAVDINQYIYLSTDNQNNLRCNVNSITEFGSNSENNYIISITDSSKTLAENADNIKNSYVNQLIITPDKKYINYTNSDSDEVELLIDNKLSTTKISELNGITKDRIRTVTQKKLSNKKYVIKSVISQNKDYDSTLLEVRSYSNRLIGNQYIVLGNFRINLNNLLENDRLGTSFEDNILTVYDASTLKTLFNIKDINKSTIELDKLLETKYDNIFLCKGYNKGNNAIAIKYETSLYLIECVNNEVLNKLICNDDTMIDSIEPIIVQNVVKVKKNDDN